MKNNDTGYVARSIIAALLFTIFACLGAVLLILGAIATTFNVVMFVIGIIMFLVFGFMSVPLWIAFATAKRAANNRKDEETASRDKETK